MNKKLILGVIMLAFILTGCNKTKDVEVKVAVDEYSKNVYETIEVMRGDVAPVLTLDLKTDEFQINAYYVPYNQLEVDKVFVSVGDKVTQGQVMASFKSEEIDEKINSYRESYQEKELMVEHYSNLMTIDSSIDYTKDIESMKEQMYIDQLYISELQAELESYSIVAEQAGTVSIISAKLEVGVVDSTDALVMVMSGSGKYSVTITDDYEFNIGDTYMASYGTVEYEMRLVEINEVGKSEEGNLKRELLFEPVSEMLGITENTTIQIIINKTVLKDVVYVPREVVFDVLGVDYVYKVDELGFREAVQVTIQEQVDGYFVIGKGLSEGEKVAIK